jgi:hypothetical protein
MTIDAGHGGGYLNFVAEIHRMPEYPWQCLDFLGTGQMQGLARRLARADATWLPEWLPSVVR